MESRLLLSTVEAIAIADAYGRSGTNGNLNYGGEPQIMVKEEGAGSNSIRYSFLKFDLSSIPGDAVINSATLQLWGWNGDLGANRNQTVQVGAYGVEDTAWVQGTATGQAQAGSLTWNNMPPLIGSPMEVRAIAPTSTHELYTWNVTSWVAGRTGLVSLGLRGQTSTADRAFFTSTENSLTAEHPRLIIVYNEPPGAAPATLTATGAPQSAALNWTAVTGATKYNIYRSTSPWDAGSWTKIGETTELSYLATGLTNGTQYSFRVRAANQFGESLQYAEASATPQAALPTAVTAINVTRAAGQITLSWPPSTGAQTYTVKRGGPSGALTALPAGTAITATTFVDETAVDGEVYRYIVTATNSLGAVDSPEVPVGVGLLGTYYDNQNYTNPMLTRIDPRISFAWGTGSPDPLIGPDTFSVHWIGMLHVPETTSYEFAMTFDDGGALYVGGELLIERTSYSAAEVSVWHYLEAGMHPIEVRHFEGSGGAGINLQWSYFSNLLGQQIPKAPIAQHFLFPPNLDAPTAAATDPAALATGSSTVLLTWSHGDVNEAGFRIMASPAGQNQFVEAGVAPAHAASFVARGLLPNTAYDFRIIAFNNTGDAAAATVSQSTLAAGLGESVLHWTYENGPGSTEITDQSGNNVNGTVSGDASAMYQSGRQGNYALLLNGQGTDYEHAYTWELAAGLNPGRAMTFATWIRPNDWAGNYYIFGRSDFTGTQYRLWNNNGRLTGEIGGLGTVSSPLPPAGQWSHVALAYDGGAVTLYINSVPVASTPASGTVREAYNNFYVGTFDGFTANQQFKGMVDDTRFYSRAIDRADLAALVSGASLPAAPSALTARTMSGLRVELKWTDNASNDTVYVVERRLGTDGEWVVASPDDYVPLGGAFIDSGLEDGAEYHYRVKATNTNGSSAWSNQVVATAVSSVLPAPWNNQDIGALALEGEAFYTAANASFTIVGAGNDIWNTADQFHYVFQPWTGDGMITARVVSFMPTDPWAKIGVMFRETLDAGSRHVANIVSRDNGTAFSGRVDTDGVSTRWSVLTGHIADPNGRREAPYWVRLKRAGDLFSAWTSPDGLAWEQLGPTQSIAMLGDPETGGIYVGLAVTSHNVNALNTAVFDNVTVTTEVPPDTPTGLGVATSFGRADLAWNPTLGAKSYQVLRSGTPGGPYTPVGATTSTTFADTTVITDQTYYYVVRAINNGGFTQSAEAWATVRALVARINFTTATGAEVPGFFKDTGTVFGPKTGTGFSYGWSIDVSGTNRDRNNTDLPFASNPYWELLDSLAHSQHSNQTGNRFWEIALPPGQYEVRLAAGDVNTTGTGGNIDSYYAFMVEGMSVLKGKPATAAVDPNAGVRNYAPLIVGGPNGERLWTDNNSITGTFVGGTPSIITVVDGRLTLTNDLDAQAEWRAQSGQTGNHGANNKINYIEIVQVSAMVSEDVHLVGTAGDDDYYVRLDPTGQTVQIWHNADPEADAPTQTVARSGLGLFTIDGGLGNDTVTVDFANGSPMGESSLSFTGGAGIDRIRVIGTADSEIISANQNQVQFGASSIALASVDEIELHGGGGQDQVAVSGAANVLFGASQDLAVLAISDTARVTLAGGADKAIRTTSLTVGAGAALDLVDNDLILTASAANRGDVLAALAAFAKAGKGGLAGVFASGATATTGLSLSINDNGSGGVLKASLGGLSAGPNDVLAKFTLIGDLDLNGTLDGDDYFMLDSAFLAESLASFLYIADLDHNDAVDAGDYFIVDKVYLTLLAAATPAPAQAAAAPAQPADASQDERPLDLSDNPDPLA